MMSRGLSDVEVPSSSGISDRFLLSSLTYKSFRYIVDTFMENWLRDYKVLGAYIYLIIRDFLKSSTHPIFSIRFDAFI